MGVVLEGGNALDPYLDIGVSLRVLNPDPV